MVLQFGMKLHPKPDDLDTLDNFDDRTLDWLLAGARHEPLSDGVDNDQPYRALPLERWRDR